MAKPLGIQLSFYFGSSALVMDYTTMLSNWIGFATVIIYDTSHASIAYRKQLPPQRMVGTIGSEWHESTPLKETTRAAQTSLQSTKPCIFTETKCTPVPFNLFRVSTFRS